MAASMALQRMSMNYVRKALPTCYVSYPAVSPRGLAGILRTSAWALTAAFRRSEGRRVRVCQLVLSVSMPFELVASLQSSEHKEC